MLAVYLMMFFGFFMAVVAGVGHSGQKTILEIGQQRERETTDFFDQAANMLLRGVTQRDMEITGVSTCRGISLSATDARRLLCRDDVLQLASWSMLTGVEDPWRNQMRGVVITQRLGVGPGVMAPVTAFAFVSPGRDRELDPVVAALMATAISTGDVRDVTRIEAPSDSDDIVRTYSNLTAQMSRWDRIQTAVERIAAAEQDQYMQDFYAFTPTIRAHIQSLLAAGYSPATVMNDKSWKNLTNASKPRLFRPETDPYRLGVDEEFETITSAIPLGSSMNLSSVVGTSMGAYPNAEDTLSIRLTNNGSPWGDGSGNINYVHSFEMGF